MTNTTKIFRLAALAAAIVALAVPAAVAADNGTPTTTDTTTTATASPAGVEPPWDNPGNYTYLLPVKAQYGPICKKGDKTGKSCKYYPLPGTVLSVYTLKGKLIRTARTGKDGMGKIKLPKGKSELRFSHSSPYKGYRLGGRTYTVTAPVYMPPPNYFLFTFCVVSGC